MTNRSTPTINHFVALIRLKSLDGSPDYIENIAQKIINNLSLTVVKKTSHLFHPKGVTLVYILSESHLAVHTWPEFSTVHLDLVTCGYRSLDQFKASVNSAFLKENIVSVEIRSVDIQKNIKV